MSNSKKGITWPIQITVAVNVTPLQERHFISLAVILMIAGMLLMARENPDLWDVELFKTLLTAITITGFLNMILSFHFSATKSDEVKTENTGKAFDAISKTADAASAPSGAREAAIAAAERTAEAAENQVDLERNR